MAGFGGLGATFSRLGTSGLGTGSSPPYPAPDGQTWARAYFTDIDGVDQLAFFTDIDGTSQPAFILQLA